MDAKKKVILSIDDDTKVLKLLDAFLYDTDYKLITTDDVHEGIRLAKKYRPDVILMDVMMPELNGYQATKILKRNAETKDIPIIFLTALTSKGDVGSAVESGGIDYIVKPFNPTNLLAKLNKATTLHSVRKSTAKAKKGSIEELGEIFQEKNDNPSNWISSYRDVAVFRPNIKALTMENWKLFRDVYFQLFEDGFKKIIFDASELRKLDASGIGLLISVNEKLKKLGSELIIVIPNKTLAVKFSFLNINDLFRVFKSQMEAINDSDLPSLELESVVEDLNICTACTYINNKDTLFCNYCGTDLTLGKGNEIIKILKKVILKGINSEYNSSDIDSINKSRNLTIDAENIPLHFNVELFGPNYMLKYKNNRILTELYQSEKLIGIQAPAEYDINIPIEPGLKVQLTSTQTDVYSSYVTKIHSIDPDKKIIYIPYSDNANILTSSKKFSVSPKIPIPVKIVNPLIGNEREVVQGYIIEISGGILSVFAENKLSEDECLAVSFTLPMGDEISSTFVMAKRRDINFTYNCEFIVIDEGERSKIIQYMYKRQIEMAKRDDT